MFNAVLGTGATLNTFDTVDGAGGMDTANIAIIGGSATELTTAKLAQFSNVETVRANSDAAQTNALDISGTAIRDLQLSSTGAAASAPFVTVAADTNVTIGGTYNAAFVMAGTNVANAKVTGDTTPLASVTFTETPGSTTPLTTIDVSGKTAAALSITGTSNQTELKLGLTETVSVTTTAVGPTTTLSALKTVDASASTGGVTYDVSNTIRVETIIGGTGIDTFIINAGDSGLSQTTADMISNFKTSGADKLDFNLTAGTATNFTDVGSSTSFVSTLTNANTVFNGTIQYAVGSTSATNHFVFVDSDLNGTADFGIIVNGTAPTFTDIIA